MTVLRSMKDFSSMNITASILLFVTAIAAAVIANSPAASVYQEFLSHELHFRIGGFNLLSHAGHNLTMIEFINDGLMTIFFLMVGLEIKRELLVGELSSFRKAALPFIAACGGMVVPVVIYSMVCAPGTEGGILVIAIFYSSHVAYEYLLWAALLYVLLYFIGKKGATNKIFFLVVGVVIWYLFLQSGIHSTISGVILAFVIPAKPQLNVGTYIERIRRIISTFPEMGANNIVLTNQQIAKLKEVESASDRVISPLQSLEDNLHGAVNYLVLPLFAFVNAGVMFSGEGEVIGGVTLAVALGLLAGKFLGIYSFTWLAVKSGLTPMPLGMNWKNISGVALLGGIGFTVSLFIANLSFGSAHPVLLNQAKLGVLSGTVMAGILGYLVLHWVLPQRR